MRTLTIDRQRTRRVLRDLATLIAAALPFAFGFACGMLLRVVEIVWLALLWLIGAGLAGFDRGRGNE